MAAGYEAVQARPSRCTWLSIAWGCRAGKGCRAPLHFSLPSSAAVAAVGWSCAFEIPPKVASFLTSTDPDLRAPDLTVACNKADSPADPWLRDTSTTSMPDMPHRRASPPTRRLVGRPGRTLCAAVGTCGDNMWTRHMCHASSTDNARGHVCNTWRRHVWTQCSGAHLVVGELLGSEGPGAVHVQGWLRVHLAPAWRERATMEVSRRFEKDEMPISANISRNLPNRLRMAEVYHARTGMWFHCVHATDALQDLNFSSNLAQLSVAYRSTLQELHPLLTKGTEELIKPYRNHPQETTQSMYAARVEMRLAKERLEVLKTFSMLEKSEREQGESSSNQEMAGDEGDRKRKR